MGGTDEGPFLGALWRLAIGDEPFLGQGNPSWTKASLSYAMAIMGLIDVWTNERNHDGACIVGTRLAACFWIHTKAVDIDGEADYWERRELLDNSNWLCLRVVTTHVWVPGDTRKLDPAGP